MNRRFWWATKLQGIGAFLPSKSGDESPHSKKPDSTARKGTLDEPHALP
ncbi:MAG: hypothetical protein JO112_04025 [Planctomycetes bacterium]|nr:hypothetical protein [Planctomycetota bacterium]